MQVDTFFSLPVIFLHSNWSWARIRVSSVEFVGISWDLLALTHAWLLAQP